jgi:hypothetical protein
MILRAGLDPASTFFSLGPGREGGPRIKSGVTIQFEQDRL